MKWFGNAQPWKKGVGDWVSQADLESQRVIRSYLLEQFPEHAFLGEEQLETSIEDGGLESSQPACCWIVDPLDGTVNFLHKLNSFSVSIALAVRDPRTGSQQVVTGAVLDPVLNEFYSATLGQGARMNGEPIQVSRCQRVGEALTVVSSNTSIQPTDPQVTRLLNVMGTSASIRRLGSAALNLCYIACGRVDAYWATNLSSWDVAAGWLIASEAGAVLEGLDAEPLNVLRPKFCCASTVELMNELRPLLQV